MSNLKVNLEKTGIKKEQLFEHSKVVEDIDGELTVKSNDENEFVGWLHLPSKYKDSEEYKRVKKCAEKIKKDSDILLVIGIGRFIFRRKSCNRSTT